MPVPNGMALVILSRDDYSYPVPDAQVDAVLSAAPALKPH